MATGGGIASDKTSLKNTIVAENIDLSGGAPDCIGSINSLGFNLFGSTVGCADHRERRRQQTNVAPLLGVLAAHGGISPSHSIPSNSPARNSGSGCPKRDQRGVRRQNCDIGSYEFR